MTTRGVVYVHSAPPALGPHVEWALAKVLGGRLSLAWAPQPAAPGLLRAELPWEAAPGTAARIASALRDCRLLRFEVTEEPSEGCDGARFSSTPTLGMFTAVIGVNGDILVPENRLRAARQAAAADLLDLATELDKLLGVPWDGELEAFRYAGEGAPVRWLHQVG